MKKREAQAWDWGEDFEHENGNYLNRCLACGRVFVGHKRRMLCKFCAPPDGPDFNTENNLHPNKIAERYDAVRESISIPDYLWRLSKRATPGEWTACGDGSVRKLGGIFVDKPEVKGEFICKPDDDADAEFIAAAVNYVRKI